jgi:hypothetical protein
LLRTRADKLAIAIRWEGFPLLIVGIVGELRPPDEPAAVIFEPPS